MIARRAESVDLHVMVPPDRGIAAASVRGGLQMLMDRQMKSSVEVDAIWGQRRH